MQARIQRALLAVAALVLSAGIAGAAAGPNVTAPRTDTAIAKQVRHEVLTYPHYWIWDQIEFRVSKGSVVLNGAVTEPYKKSDLGHIVQKIPGVTSVTNELRVLPLSPMDNQLRLEVARAIYRDTTLSRYAIQPIPPIHIIVDRGHVTLEGVVNNNFEKQVAGMRAAGAGLSFGPIINHLRVEHPTSKNG